MAPTSKMWFSLCLLAPALLAAKCDDNFGVKTLKKNGWQDATALVPTPDGGAVIAGTIVSGGDDHDVYVLKVNSVGDVVWSRTFGGDLQDDVLDVVKSGDAYVVASYVYEGNQTVPLTLFKVSETGSLLWERKYTVEDVNISAVASADDGGFVLAGSYQNDRDDSSGFATVRLDSKGDKRWQNIVVVEDADALVRSVTQTQDGGFALGGTRYDFGAYDHQAVFYKTDPSGDILWAKEYGNAGVAEEISSVVATQDGGFVAAGSRGIDYFGTPPPPQISKNALVVKFNASGDIEWDAMYGGEAEDSAKRIRTTMDGGYVFAGTTHSYGFQNQDAYVAKLDALGNQEWYINHPGTANIAEAVDVQQLQNGTYIATGKILNLIQNWDIFVMHLDENGGL